MTTTDHRTGTDDDTAVVLLADRQRRRAHLDHLLEVRSRLAITAAEQRSHRLPEMWETTRLLYSTEETIHEGWPVEYDKRLPDWVQQDAQLEHTPPALAPACAICRALAAYHGVNIVPPRAA